MSDGIDVPFNYSAITERLYLGSRPRTGEDIASLHNDAISHILNVCETDDAPLQPSRPGLTYLFNPTPDDGQSKPHTWFQRSLRFVMPVLAQPSWRVFVHCYDGIDRSAVTVYAILIAFGLKAFDAEVLIKRHRPEALWRYISDANVAVIAGW